MTKTLDVYLENQLTGHLRQEASGQLGFTYAAAWLASPEPRALSQSLPLQDALFHHEECRPFFAGILPDAEKRNRIAQVVGVSARNDFALLDQLGGDCAGAVVLLPTGAQPPVPDAPNYEELGDAALGAALERLPTRPLLAGEPGIRLSLAGAQDKLPVFLSDDGRMFLPHDGAPSSHIVKPPMQQFPDTVHNEAFCLRLAKDLGLYSTPATIRAAGGKAYLLVTRYDRVAIAETGLRRLHQEDFCQALGIPPELKYQNEGGPSVADCFALVRRACSRPAIDLLRLLDFLTFNALVGNHDAHGKNYSLVYDGRTVALAPLYDVVSTIAYPDLAPQMAMKIGSQYAFDRVMPRHWEQLAKDSGLGAPHVRRRVLDLSTRLPDAALRLRAVLAERDQASTTIDRIVDLVSARAKTMRETLER